MGSLKKIVKKVARPKVLLPLALLATGGAGAGLFGPAAKAKLLGTMAGSGGLGGTALATPATKGILGGLLGSGGQFSTAAKIAGASGGLGSLALMSQGKDKPLDTSKDDDAAQAAYDYHMMMSKGIMSPEDARKSFASYGSGMKGDYTPGTEMGAGRYEELYPSLNYTGLNRYNPNPNPGPLPDKKKLREYNPYVMAPGMADGGRIGPSENAIIGDDELSQRLFQEIYGREESPDIEASEDMMNFSRETQDLNKQRMEETLRQYQELLQSEEMNMGGRVGLRSGGEPGTLDDADEHSFRMFNKPYRELNEFELDEFDEEMSRLRSKFMNQGGPVRGNYNMGGLGSIPQTEQVPQGMQLEGRGGGFIPMGAKEKHDDVPAMLAKNEFVMTSDAVKAAGGGSVNKGAQVMYDLMNSLESKV